MMGIIGVEHHHISCVIGVNPEEWVEEQSIFVDLKLEADFVSCAGTDSLRQTIDYVTIANLCTKIAKSKQYKLLETLAWDLIHQVMETFKVNWVWVKIKKPKGLSSAQYTFVEFEKRNTYGLDTCDRRG